MKHIRLGDLDVSRIGLGAMSMSDAYTGAGTNDDESIRTIPELGGVKLSKLSPVMIEAFLAEKAGNGRLDGTGGLGPASVRRLQVTLTKALSAAVRHGLLARNPTDFADKPKVPQKDVTETVWTPEQIMVFLEQTKRNRLAPL